MAQPVPPGTLSNGQINLPLTSATTASTDNIHQNYKNQPNSHSGQQFNNQTSSTTPNSKMIGTSVPWNPNATAIPSYPNDETLDAEYRAFLSTYRSSGAPGPAPVRHDHAPAQPTVGYGHEEKDKASRIESRDSLSASPYSTANNTALHYTSSDPYPPFNQQDYSLGHSQDLITTGVDQQRRQTVDHQQMYALSPESFASLESPPSVGMSLSSQQQQQYFPHDTSYYYGSQQQQQPQSSPNWMNQQPTAVHHSNPQIPAEYNPYNNQHDINSAYAHNARPPASTTSYPTQGYQQQYQPSTGVAPGQVLGGGLNRGPAHAGLQQKQQQQSNYPGRVLANPGSVRDAMKGTNPRPPQVSTAAQIQTNRAIVKPAPPAARASNKKRKVQEEEESDSSDEYYGDEQGQHLQTGGNNPGGSSSNRLPGACAPCKRLKMKCVFPDGQNDCCQRCRNSGRASQCVVGPRKPRQPSNKKEMLLQKLKEQDTVIKSKDAVIQSLLEQIQNPHIKISLRESPSISSSAAAAGIPADLQAQHDEKPIDKAILDWVARAQESIRSTPGYKYFERHGVDEAEDSSNSSEYERNLGRNQLSPTKSVSDSGRSGSRLAAPEAGGQHSVKSSPKIHGLPLETTPIGLLAELSLEDNKEKEKQAHSRRSRSRSKSRSASGAEESESHTGIESSAGGGENDEDDGAIGVASRNYFQPAPPSHHEITNNMMERKNIPEIMTSGLISPAEVDKLFKIYFDRLNVFISILDPVLHTPATTFGRCPFLFTVVCAIASRYHTDRPELYSIAMHFARRAAASSLIEGAKSVELCQAYILMSVYSMPSRKWEDAREWLYLGLAIRMATDLNLHVKSTTKVLNEHHEREILNRTRTWLNIYNLDRSASAQLGRPASIRADSIIRSCHARGGRQAWWKSSPVNDPFDLHLCAYTDLLSSVIARFQEHVYWDPATETTGLRTDLDLVKVAFEHDEKLQECNARLAVSFATHSDASSPQCAYRTMLLPFYVNYLRLVMLSLGFQQAMTRGAENVDPKLVKYCLDAACGVVRTVVEDLAPTDFLRYAPDGHFVFSSFASAFLIKMLRPEHASLLEEQQRTYIIDLVERLVDTLKSPRIAVDVRHTPMLYSRFLAGLLAKYKASENAEMTDDGAASATTHSDTMGLPTPPMDKREAPATPDLSGGRSFSTAAGVSRHKPSPSIEISPPEPDPASGMPPPQPQMLYDPSNMEHALFPPQMGGEDSNTYAASTVHPASTIHGSQYGAHDPMAMDDHILAPMLAMDAPGFWGSMMLPGIAWPAEDNMQWGMNLDVIDEQDPAHYQQGGEGY